MDLNGTCPVCGKPMIVAAPEPTGDHAMDEHLARLYKIVAHNECYDRVTIGVAARRMVVDGAVLVRNKNLGADGVMDPVFNTAFRMIMKGLTLYESWLDIVAKGWRDNWHPSLRTRESLARRIVERPEDTHKILNQFRHDATKAATKTF